jgi:hypothetical protein
VVQARDSSSRLKFEVEVRCLSSRLKFEIEVRPIPRTAVNSQRLRYFVDSIERAVVKAPNHLFRKGVSSTRVGVKGERKGCMRVRDAWTACGSAECKRAPNYGEEESEKQFLKLAFHTHQQIRDGEHILQAPSVEMG